MMDKPNARQRRGARDEKRGTLLDSLPRTPAAPRDDASRSGSYPRRRPPEDYRDASDQLETPGRLTLPSMPLWKAARRSQREAARDTWDEYADYDQAYDDAYAEADPANLPRESPLSGPPASYSSGKYRNVPVAYADEYDAYGEDGAYQDERPLYETRTRARSLARPLTPALPHYNDPDDARLPLYEPLPTDSAPHLAAFRPAPPLRRARLDTRAIAQAARSPWTLVRLALALSVLLLALINVSNQVGELTQPLMIPHAQAGAAAGGSITSMVRPETQLLRPDLYDSYAQFQNWGGAACSAAAISEILTAYGVPNATIGREIDELGSYISPNGGLLNRHGFEVVAAKHNLRADASTSLTYNQLVYITAQLGMPVIVNVRMSYGYYHFFSGGHFLTVVGGDAQGLKIVDSSEYYIHYLPKDVFYQMFTGYTAAIVPVDYQYTLPKN